MKKISLGLFFIVFSMVCNVQAAPLGASREELEMESCTDSFVGRGRLDKDAAKEFCTLALANLPKFWTVDDYKDLKNKKKWKDFELKYVGKNYRTVDEEIYAMNKLCQNTFVMRDLACLMKHKADEKAAGKKLPYPIKYWKEKGGFSYEYIGSCENDGQGWANGICVAEKMRKHKNKAEF